MNDGGRWALGLTHRTVLLLVAVVLASLVIVGLAFEWRRRGDYADFRDTRARNAAALVHTARVMLLAVPPERRPEVQLALDASGTVEVYDASSVQPPAAPKAAGAAAPSTAWHTAGDLTESLARYAQPPVEVLYRAVPSPRYWIRQDIAGETWWIVVPVAEPGPPPAPPVPALVLILAVLLVAAAVYAATITRPIAALADATRRVGDAWPDPVQPRGPAELRRLAESFNAMLQRLREVESERRVLIGGLPHDLRAPLARLRLRLAMLPESPELGGVHADLASVERIVRQFIDYLRGGEGLDGEVRPLGALLDEALGPYRSLGHDVAAASVAGADVPVPAVAMRRILDNLLDNALRHGREPVRVGATADGTRVEVTVTDAGGGVPAGEHDRAFEPFTKLDAARGSDGCGLGLAIVRQLARRHGGDVALEQRDGAFTARVVLRSPPSQHSVISSNSRPGDPGPVFGSGERHGRSAR